MSKPRSSHQLTLDCSATLYPRVARCGVGVELSGRLEGLGIGVLREGGRHILITDAAFGFR
jgi:hypothetical protein